MTETSDRTGSETDRPGLIGLVKRLPTLVSRLIHDEIRAVQAEIAGKIKAASLGAGLVVAGAVLAWFALGAFIAGGIIALALVLEPWLAAVLVGVALLVIAGLLVLLGVGKLKKGVPPLPNDSIDSIKEDIRTVTGTAK